MKYVIEIEDVPFSKVRIDDNGAQNINLYRVKGFNALVFDDEGLNKLTPLDNELDEAYQRGFETGSHEATTLEYQQGLNDAWEAARKIFGDEVDGGLPVNELRNAFGFENVPFYTADILRTNTASEAIAKLKAYEEQQKADEIKVGDEVIPIDIVRRPFIVVSIENNVISGFDITDGYTSRGYHRDETRWEKTGRHFSQIEELIKAVKGELRGCSTCKYDDESGIPPQCVGCYAIKGYNKWEPKGSVG